MRKKFRWSIMLCLLFIISGCYQIQNQDSLIGTPEQRLATENAISTLEKTISSEKSEVPILTPEISITPATSEFSDTQTPTPEPTLFPIIEEAPEYSEAPEGRILFLSNENPKRLYIMDGNGRNVYQVMEDASGSPDWSVDGQKIAIGCENNRSICILDAQKTIASCHESKTGNICDAVIQQKILLPDEVGENIIYNISWSYTGQKMLVEYAVLPGRINTFLLYLEDEPRWELLFEGLAGKADFSPVADRIMVSNMPTTFFEVNLESKMIVNDYSAPGDNLQWSPDGEYVAFVFHDTVGPEPGEVWLNSLTAMKVDILHGSGESRWQSLFHQGVYFPENWQQRYLIFSDNEYRILSWSPDSKHIAVVGDYRYEGDSQIFRLDIETGEIFVLTTKLDDVYGEMQYIAPAWGP